MREKTKVMLARNKEIRKEDEAKRSLILSTHRDHVLHTNESFSSLSHSISFLLQEYEVVFPKVLSSGYLLRGIEHQIDFMLGTQLPTKLNY